jgi:hypothetical protein
MPYTDKYGGGLIKEGVKQLQKDLISQLNSKELLDKFYNGSLTVEPGSEEADHQYYLPDLLDYPELIEQLENRMKSGYIATKTGHTLYAEISLEGKPISLRQIIEWGYLGIEYAEESEEYEEFTWDEVIESHFNGKKIDPPVMTVTFVQQGATESVWRFTLGSAIVVEGYINENLVPVELILGGTREDGQYTDITIPISHGDVAITDFVQVALDSILLLSDIEMSFPLISTYVGYADYSDGETLRLDDLRQDVAVSELNALYFEVFPFYKRGYSWSKTMECQELAKAINNRLSVDDALTKNNEATIYKLYMNGDTPEIMDCCTKEVLTQKDNTWLFTILIKGLQKINENIGVAYIILPGAGKLEGKLRYRKDEKTGEYVVTLW